MHPKRGSRTSLDTIRPLVDDAPEQKQAFEAAQRMAAIVESSDDAIIGMTLDSVITSWNPAMGMRAGLLLRQTGRPARHLNLPFV